ncbi:MAG: ABC transporter substrate-binding protein [Oscillospiraceae bacterium]|nr:ABC transporter substrate-binding protein [Oscillospiraceae bacterium]
MKKINIKKIFAVIAASAMTLTLASCAASGGKTENTSAAGEGTEKSAELTTITLGVPGANGMAMESASIAQVEKFFDKELEKAGYKLEVQGFALAGPAVNEAFASGAIDFTVYGDQPAITAASNGIDVKILASVNNYLEHALLVSNNIEFNSLEDLKGKRIVVGFGTPILTSYLLKIFKFTVGETHSSPTNFLSKTEMNIYTVLIGNINPVNHNLCKSVLFFH